MEALLSMPTIISYLPTVFERKNGYESGLVVVALLGAAPLLAQNAELSGLTPTFSVEPSGMNFFQDRSVDTVDRVL